MVKLIELGESRTGIVSHRWLDNQSGNLDKCSWLQLTPSVLSFSDDLAPGREDTSRNHTSRTRNNRPLLDESQPHTARIDEKTGTTPKT
jgi:hypothetical protein